MIDFLFELRRYCLDAVKDLSLESKDRGDLPAVKGYIGDIPGEMTAPPASDFPLLIFRLTGFEDPPNGVSTLTARIIAGVYNPEDKNGEESSAGYHDLLNILRRLRQALLKLSTLGRRWRRTGPLEGGPFDTQMYPYFFGDIVVQFDERQTSEEFTPKEELDIYGTAYGNDQTNHWRKD